MCELFKKTFLPKSLLDLNIFMIGCGNNSNSISLECIKRKCKSFVGFDKNNASIQKLKSIHSEYVLDNISFVYDDLEDYNRILNIHGHGDLVFYNTLYNSNIDNDKMYDLLANITKDVLIYESYQDVDIDIIHFMSIMKSKGFYHSMKRIEKGIQLRMLCLNI